ncbi:MAG: peptidoglycan-binding protein [Chromatiaceae bacterium]|nr:peptidoglycan-binding protein [Chromatiaceae bacterium]
MLFRNIPVAAALSFSIVSTVSIARTEGFEQQYDAVNPGTGGYLRVAGFFEGLGKSLDDATRRVDEYIQGNVPRENRQRTESSKSTPLPSPPSTEYSSTLSRRDHQEIQQRLADQGYSPGPIDGQPGSRTRAAIRQYQIDNGLQVDGRPSVYLLEQLRKATGRLASTENHSRVTDRRESVQKNQDTKDQQEPDFVLRRKSTRVGIPQSSTVPNKAKTAEDVGPSKMAVNSLGLPMIGDYVVNLLYPLQGEYTSAVFKQHDVKIFDKLWRRLLDQLILSERPGFIDNEGTADYFLLEHFSQDEYREFFAAISPSVAKEHRYYFNMLDNFEKQEAKRRFAEIYANRLATTSPAFPLPLVSISKVEIGQYDFDTKRFPITYSRQDGGFFGIPKNGAQAVADAGLDKLPQYIQIAPDNAKDFWNSLEKHGFRDRVAYLAVFGKLTGLTTKLNQPPKGDYDPNSIRSFSKLSPQFTSQIDRMALYSKISLERDMKLDGLIEEYNYKDFMRKFDPVAHQAELDRAEHDKVHAIPIESDASLAPIVDDYVPNVAFVDGYVKTGGIYRSASEFKRDELLVTERNKIHAIRPSAETFWLGGKVALGRYLMDEGQFEVEKLELSAARNNIDTYIGEIKLTIENLGAFSRLKAQAEQAERATALVSDRKYEIRARVRPIAGDFKLQYGERPEGRLGVDIEELYVLASGYENGERSAFILLHYLSDTAMAAEPGVIEDNLPAWTDRPVLNPDIVELMAVRATPGPLSEPMLRQLFADRWMFEQQIGTSVPEHFFKGNVKPTNLTFERQRSDFEKWLRKRADSLPELFTIHWRGRWVVEERRCHHVHLVQQHEPSLNGYMSGKQGYLSWKKSFNDALEAGTVRGPSREAPVLLDPSNPPSTKYPEACDPQGRDSLVEELRIDSQADFSSVLIIDQLPVFRELGRVPSEKLAATVDIAIDRVETVPNSGNIPHVRIFANFQEIWFLNKLNTDIGEMVDASPQNLVAHFDTTVFQLSEAPIASGVSQAEVVTPSMSGSIDDLILQGTKQQAALTPEIITEPNKTFGPDGQIWSFAVSDSGRLALLGLENELSLWNIETGERVRTLIDYGGFVRHISWSPDARFALSGHDDGNIRLWDLVEGRAVRGYPLDDSGSLSFLPDGKRFITYRNAHLEVYDVQSGKLLRRFDGGSRRSTIAFNSDASMVASGDGFSGVKIWDLNSGELIRQFSGHSGSVSSVAFSPDNTQIVSGSGDSTLRLWDVALGREVRKFEGHSQGVVGVAYTSDGRYVLSASDDSSIRVWSPATGQLLRTYIHEKNMRIRGPWLSADNRQFFSTHYEVKVWNLDDIEQ